MLCLQPKLGQSRVAHIAEKSKADSNRETIPLPRSFLDWLIMVMPALRILPYLVRLAGGTANLTSIVLAYTQTCCPEPARRSSNRCAYPSGHQHACAPIHFSTLALQ